MDPSNLLSLPTDSLYKFMAMSGLVILLISLIVPFIIRKQFLFKLFELRRDLNLNKIKKDEISEKIKELKTKLNDMKGGPKNNSGGIDVWSKNAIEVLKEQKEFSIILEHANCEINKMEYLSSAIKIINTFAVIGFIAGGALTISGFYLWYVKLQVFVDNAVVSGVTP